MQNIPTIGLQKVVNVLVSERCVAKRLAAPQCENSIWIASTVWQALHGNQLILLYLHSPLFIYTLYICIIFVKIREPLVIKHSVLEM